MSRKLTISARRQRDHLGYTENLGSHLEQNYYGVQEVSLQEVGPDDSPTHGDNRPESTSWTYLLPFRAS